MTGGGGEAWADDEKTKAKARYDANVGRPSKEEKSKETFPSIKEQQSRDAIAERIGVSGRLSLLIGLAASHGRWQHLFPQPCQRVIESSLVSSGIMNVRYLASRMT